LQAVVEWNTMCLFSSPGGTNLRHRVHTCAIYWVGQSGP